MNKELTEQEDDVKLFELHKIFDCFIRTNHLSKKFNDFCEENNFDLFKAAQSKQKESSKRVYTLQNLKNAYFEGECWGIGADACITFEEFINSLNKT